jgi:uncharacterized membrane protein YvbJ
MTKKCNECGFELEDDWTVCPKCGSTVEKGDELDLINELGSSAVDLYTVAEEKRESAVKCPNCGGTLSLMDKKRVDGFYNYKCVTCGNILQRKHKVPKKTKWGRIICIAILIPVIIYLIMFIIFPRFGLLPF